MLKQRADEGDRAAQFSQGCALMVVAGGPTMALSGAAGRSPKAKVGWHYTSGPSCVDGHRLTTV